jgi:hypothetical protein
MMVVGRKRNVKSFMITKSLCLKIARIEINKKKIKKRKRENILH